MKNKIARNLLQLLIDNHDDGDSLVRESSLVNSCIEKFSYEPNTDEISECVNLINSSLNRKVITEGWIPIGGLLSSRHESSYITEYSINNLKKILQIINVESENTVQNEDVEFENIRQFQKKWKNMPMVEKQKIAIETDRINNIGANLYSQDKIHEAITFFNKALDVMPTNDDALKNLIICYKYIGELDKIPTITRRLNYLTQ